MNNKAKFLQRNVPCYLYEEQLWLYIDSVAFFKSGDTKRIFMDKGE